MVHTVVNDDDEDWAEHGNRLIGGMVVYCELSRFCSYVQSLNRSSARRINTVDVVGSSIVCKWTIGWVGG